MQVGGFLAVGCWMFLDYTTKRRRSSAIDELIQDEWEGFQRWMDYKDLDFEVRRFGFGWANHALCHCFAWSDCHLYCFNSNIH